MWWGMGFTLGVIWLTLLIVLGVATWRNGHMLLFWFGIIFPVLWVFGAAMRPRLEAQGGA
jgi:uncharacterized membrane protein